MRGVKGNAPYQTPVDRIDLLPMPGIEEIELFGGASRAIQNLAIGWMAVLSGDINKKASSAARDFMLELIVPTLHEGEYILADPPVRASVVAELSSQLYASGPVVLDGAMSWLNQQEVAVRVGINRRFTPKEMVQHFITVYYEFLALLSHELGHAIDEDTKNKADYAGQIGEKYEHRYSHSAMEMRARVWACQITYTHAYLYLKRWYFSEEAAEKMLGVDADPARFLDFLVNRTPAGRRAMGDLNEDNQIAVAKLVQECIERVEPELDQTPPPLANDPEGIAPALGMPQDCTDDEMEKTGLGHRFADPLRATMGRRPRANRSSRQQNAVRRLSVIREPMIHADQTPPPLANDPEGIAQALGMPQDCTDDEMDETITNYLQTTWTKFRGGQAVAIFDIDPILKFERRVDDEE